MAYEPDEDVYESPVIFRPDDDLVDRLQAAIYRRQARVNLKVEMTDLYTGQVRTVFVRWSNGDLNNLAHYIQNALDTDPNLDRFEDYFWLFWRGWAGCLNPDLLHGLPAVTVDLLNKLEQGIPLRGGDLRRLQAALEWAYADASIEWGDTNAWQEGTISPGHLSVRKKLGEFIHLRMIALHGSDYQNAPVHP